MCDEVIGGFMDFVEWVLNVVVDVVEYFWFEFD